MADQTESILDRRIAEKQAELKSIDDLIEKKAGPLIARKKAIQPGLNELLALKAEIKKASKPEKTEKVAEPVK